MSVSDCEDVLDYILEKKIGCDFASSYTKIAQYIETKVKDMRKAEETIRTGLNHLSQSEKLSKEHKSL